MMKYGVHLPNFGSYGDVRLLADLARTATTPYDVVIGGITEPEFNAHEKIVKPFIEAGATWWLEDLSPLRLEKFGWEDLWQDWDIEPFRARIEAGPPRE